MNAQDAIRQIMIEKAMSNSELARRLDTTRQVIWNRLNSDRGMSVSVLAEMAKELDYRVMLVPVASNIRRGIEID